MKLEDLINGLQQLGLNHIAYIIAGITVVVFICNLAFKFFGQYNQSQTHKETRQKQLEQADEEMIKAHLKEIGTSYIIAKTNFQLSEIKKSISRDYFNKLKNSYKTSSIQYENQIYDFLIKYDRDIYFNFQQYTNMCNKKIYEEIVKPIKNLKPNLSSKLYKKRFKNWQVENLDRYSKHNVIESEKQHLNLHEKHAIDYSSLPSAIQKYWNVDNPKEMKKVKNSVYKVTDLYSNENFIRKFSRQPAYLKYILEKLN